MPTDPPTAPPPTDWSSLGERAALGLVPDPILRDALGRDAPTWVDFLVDHPDPGVRDAVCAHLPARRDGGALLARLLSDPSPPVRKTATWRLGQVPPAPAHVDPLWQRFQTTRSTAAQEALRAWHHHAVGHTETAAVLDALARDPRTPTSARHTALGLLAEHQPNHALFGTLPALVAELSPAPVGWALTLAVIHGVRVAGRGVRADPALADFPDLRLPAWLTDVDHAGVQRALRGG